MNYPIISCFLIVCVLTLVKMLVECTKIPEKNSKCLGSFQDNFLLVVSFPLRVLIYLWGTCQFTDYANKFSHHQGICDCDLKAISIGSHVVSLFLQLMHYSIEKNSHFLEKTTFLASKKFSVSEHVPHMILLIKLDHRSMKHSDFCL